MKKIYKIFPAFLLSLMLGSCQKFLDVKKTSTISSIETANDVQLILNDYSNMNTGYPSDGEVSADDYYLNNGGYLSANLQATDRDLYTWSPEAIRPSASPQWQTPYKIIYNANLVIETTEKLKGKENQALLDDLKGQALFFRAYALWNVAQLYCNAYSTNSGSDPGIPVRLSSDINGKSERGTVKQTYDQILTDLKSALNLLNATNPGINASRPNKMAANAMLARVYLSMNEYVQAMPYATAVLQVKSGDLINYNILNITSNTPFTRFNSEVVFQSLMAPNPGLNPGSSAGSPFSRIKDDLYTFYGPNDLRKKIFFKSNSPSVGLPNTATPPVNVSVSPPDGTYRFTGNYEPQASATLFNGLAVDEMFLIHAECAARAGDKETAMTDLNTLLATRWLTGTSPGYSATDATDALNKVLLERRKELVMRGLRWTDVRRLKLSLIRQTKTVTFTGTSVAPVRVETVDATYNLPAGDPRFTLLIPTEVIQNASLAQNPR